jgi:hypothetical protein
MVARQTHYLTVVGSNPTLAILVLGNVQENFVSSNKNTDNVLNFDSYYSWEQQYELPTCFFNTK